MTIETTEDIKVENLTVTEDAVATRLNVPESASVNALEAADVTVNNLNVLEDAEVENLTVTNLTAAEGLLESLIVNEAAEVENINVLEDTVTERLDVYTSASINALTAATAEVTHLNVGEGTVTKDLNVTHAADMENLFVAEHTGTRNLDVLEEATVNHMYIGGIKCGQPHGFAEFSAPGQLWTQYLFADEIRGRNIELKGSIDLSDASLTTEEGPIDFISDVNIRGDLQVGGRILPETPLTPAVPIPSDHPDFDQFNDTDKVNILLVAVADIITKLTAAGIMAPEKK